MTSAATTINALIMTILGGIGTLVGPILGAGLMQIVGQFFYTWFGPRWPLVFGLVFILIVYFPALRHRGHLAAEGARCEGRPGSV